MNMAGPVASAALVKVAALIGKPTTPVRQLRSPMTCFNDTYAAVLGSTGNASKAERVALSRVVFEVFKDLKQLTPPSPQ